MKITFSGAAQEVTGSCYYLEACGKKIMVDCGMRQGPDEYFQQDMPVDPSELDYVFLTHAHIDHSGRLPLLSKFGFKGNVFSTFATGQLCQIMLRDSAHIQEFEAEWHNRKRSRSGEDPYEPLYNMADAERILQKFVTYGYNTMIDIAEGIRLRFTDAGHLLGSASLEVWLSENNVSKKIVFSGDIGNNGQPLINDPSYIDEADYVVMEATYGDRNHNETPDYAARLAAIIQSTFDKGGNVVIPSFAVGRTQEILYYIREIHSRHLIKGFDRFSVYVDSPLAIEATSIFNKTVEGYYDEDALALINQGINPISFAGLQLSVTADESKAINFNNSSKVIISASGMCEAGRIRHHLKHNLWRPESSIVFVGYQAGGTLGRALLEGAKVVRLFGETIGVKASIIKLEGMSAHADKDGLLKWIDSYNPKPVCVFVTHGEQSVCDSFVEKLKEEKELIAYAPKTKAVFDLLNNKFIDYGISQLLIKAEKDKTLKRNSVYERLVLSGERLISIVHSSKGKANKDLARFADQINSLCDKWTRQ